MCVATSQIARLIYDCCRAGGLFLSQLHSVAAYLRLFLGLMDDWSRASDSNEVGRGGNEGEEQSSGPPVVEYKPAEPS